MNPITRLISTLSDSLPDIPIPGVSDIVRSVPSTGAIPIELLIGIGVAIVAAWTYRETLAHALDERRDQAWWAGKYGLLVAGGFFAGRQLGAVVGTTPAEWADTVTTALTSTPLLAVGIAAGGIVTLWRTEIADRWVD